MKKSAPIAKISRPSIKGVFERKRLFRLLDRSRGRPVLWLSGPAGSGKTTLIASWLDNRKLPCLWYQLDSGDADLSTFFYYLGMAGKKAAPRKKLLLPLLTPEYLMDVPTFSRRYFENLCGRVKSPFYIIFDNYQDVPADSAFHAVLASGMTAIPEGVHAVFVSRTEPPPAFSGLIAGSKMELLGWDELQLTPDESGAIVRLHTTDKQDAKTLKWMYDRTKGWAAGVVLLARAAKDRLIEHGKVDALSPDKVFDYFASELFARTDEKVRDFLVKTSALTIMTPAMAEQLTGNKDAAAILDGLNRRNYFIYKSSQPGIAYQYHPLFRDFLRSRVKELYGEVGAARLQKQAAGLLEEAGQIEDAAALYIETEDREALARLALTHAPQLVSTGRYGLLDAWLSAIPAEMSEALPWLLYWKGVCRFFVNPLESQAIFEKVFNLFQDRRDSAGIFLSWAGVVESISIANENVKPLDHWIQILPGLVRRHGGFPSPDIESRTASSMFTALFMRQPSHPHLEKWIETALLTTDNYSRARTLFHIAMFHICMGVGETAKGMAAIDSLRRLVKTPGFSPLGVIQLKLCEAIYFKQMGSQDLCMKAADEGLDHAEKSGIRLLSSLTAGHGAWGAMIVNDLEATRRYLDAYDSKPLLNLWERNFHDFLLATHAMVTGELRTALHHSDLSVESSEQAGVPWTENGCKFLNAAILHRLGEHDKADKRLDQVYRKAVEIKSEVNKYEYFLCKALFALDRGREKEAVQFLRKSALLGKQKGFHDPQYYLMSRPDKARLCVKALEHGIEPDYFRGWIRRDGLVPDDPPLHIENWPWPVRIHTLGRFELFRDNKPVNFSGKVQKKPLEMLKSLIAFGGRDVSEERIIDALWPDTEGGAARSNFKSTLHRLRQMIGLDEAVRVQEGRLSLDRRFCWVDVRAFEHALESSEFPRSGRGQAPLRSSELKGEKKQSAIEKAISIYRGHFLPADTRLTWSAVARERLRSRFLDLMIKAGEALESEGQWKKAAELFEQGIEKDAACEEFYQHLMACCKRLGQEARAAGAYNRCRMMLSQEFGLEPSSRTEEIRSSITRPGR